MMLLAMSYAGTSHPSLLYSAMPLLMAKESPRLRYYVAVLCRGMCSRMRYTRFSALSMPRHCWFVISFSLHYPQMSMFSALFCHGGCAPGVAEIESAPQAASVSGVVGKQRDARRLIAFCFAMFQLFFAVRRRPIAAIMLSLRCRYLRYRHA